MTGAFPLTIEAPAKINLGLEILRRREDGYHDLRSVMTLIDLTDELTFTPIDVPGHIEIEGVPGISPDDNLITRSVELFRAHTGDASGYRVRVIKRIPAPAGLGSASSNAAATLLAMDRLTGASLPRVELHALATQLGSDVPFFLGTATASISETGTEIVPLPDPAGWLLVVVPQIDLIAKTAKLYGMIGPEDWTDGGRIDRLCEDLRAGRTIDPGLLGNAFERPLRDVMPYDRKVVRMMTEAGCKHVALSGAGPARYALFEDQDEARATKDRLRPLLGPHDYTAVTTFRHIALRETVG